MAPSAIAQVSYLGYSYGTQIGATYATLFPRRVRALVLDGAVDVEGFVDHPIRDSRHQAQAFEQALSRFFSACRARRDRCGLGASPRAAYRALARKLDRAPLPVFGPSASSVDGDDLRAATLLGLNQKQLWPALEGALAEARRGDGSLLRTFADVFFEREGPSVLDPYVAIYALDGRWPARPAPHLRDGRSAYRRFDHFWWAAGYSTLALGLWPVQPQGARYGPVDNSRGAPTTLVVGTTHDPATPYVWAERLTADLGNARLLTMRGDGHTASFGNNSPCIDAAVLGYLEDGTLPPPNTSCSQDVPSTAQPLRSARAVRRTLEKVRAGLDPRAGVLRLR